MCLCPETGKQYMEFVGYLVVTSLVPHQRALFED